VYEYPHNFLGSRTEYKYNHLEKHLWREVGRFVKSKRAKGLPLRSERVLSTNVRTKFYATSGTNSLRLEDRCDAEQGETKRLCAGQHRFNGEYRVDMQSEEVVLNVVQMVVHVSLWLRKPRGLIAN
jgi:hypothetical protein